MNRFGALSLFGALILTGTSYSQVSPAVSVAEPQYINSFYAVDENGKLIELEHQNVTTFRSKIRPLPVYATAMVQAEFKPAHAPLSLPANAQFIVRGRSPLDPSSRYSLRSLKVSKDHREILVTQAHGSVLGGSATSKLDEGAVPIRFEEYGVNSYRLTPERPLQPGEYALALRGVVTELYCFRVGR